MRRASMQKGAEMCRDCAGTRIFETRGDGTRWEYVISDDGVRVGQMVGTERDDYITRGYTYSAQTGGWEKSPGQ